MSSYQTSSILGSTFSYDYTHKHIQVLNAIVTSTKDASKKCDITETLNNLIKHENSYETLSIDSGKLNKYVGYDIHFGFRKELKYTIVFSDNLHDVVSNTTHSEFSDTVILENSNIYTFSQKNLNIKSAVIKLENNQQTVIDVIDKLILHKSEDENTLTIDSSKFNELIENDTSSKKHMELVFSYSKNNKEESDSESDSESSSSSTSFSIDKVNTITKEYIKCVNKLNFTLKVINQYTDEIKEAKEYASVLRPIFEKKFTDNDVSINGYVVIETIEPSPRYCYFFESVKENDNKRLLTDPLQNTQRLTSDIDIRFNELRKKYPDQKIFNIINWYKWADSIKVTFNICIPNILDKSSPWIRILAGVNITPYFPSITSVDLLPQSYKTYLDKLQDAFNNYLNNDYNPLLGTVYQFGTDRKFNTLKVVSSQDYPSWNGQLIVDSHIPGSNIDMPEIIYQINTELNRNYTGMSEREIVIVEYAIGSIYYTGVIKMLKIVDYDGLCYQIQSININELFEVYKKTVDVNIQGNLNVTRYNGDSVIETDNTRKITTFHDKVGINQQPHEVKGLLDIDNLTQQTVLDLFDTFVPYDVNSTDIIQIITQQVINQSHDCSSFSKIDQDIIDLFAPSGELFDYKNQCTVFSVPIKPIIKNDDMNILHTDGIEVGKSIITSDYSFTRLQRAVKEVNQMEPEIANANDPSFIFSFRGLLQSPDKKWYMKSARAIIDIDKTSSEKRLIFVVTYLDVTNIMNDDSTGKPLLNVMNYMSKEFRFINYVSLLFKDTTPESGFYDANGDLAKDDKGNILLQQSIQNNEYFSDRWGLLPESYMYAADFDTRIYLLNEDSLHWNNLSVSNLWNGDVKIKGISDYVYAQRKRLYNHAINSTHVVSYFWNSFTKITCSTLIKVGSVGNERTLLIGSGFSLANLINQSMIVKGDNTISGNFFVNDSNNNNIFKVDNVKKTITNMYKVGIGMDEPTTILDIKDTTVSDILSQLDAGTKGYNIINKIAASLRAAAPFTTDTDFRTIIDDVYADEGIVQNVDNFARFYELNMDTMLADDIVVLRQWLYPEWDGLLVGDIQDAANQFSLDFLKENGQAILDTEMIYNNGLILRFYQHVFGWKFTRGLFLKIGEKMYLLAIGTNVQNYGLRPDSNTNIPTLMDNNLRGNLTNNHIYTIMNDITPVNKTESLKELRRMNVEYKDIPITKFILTIDMSDIKKTTYQNIFLNEDLTSVILGDIIKIIDFEDYSTTAKYKNFWIMFDNKKYKDNMSVNDFNVIYYEDLYYDFVTGIKCIEKTGNVFTLLCAENSIQDIIKPSLSVEGDAKITGDLLVTNKSNGTNFVSIDPDNHFMGIGTDERFINYQDRIYTTTSNIYAGRHNVNISHDTYPVMVVERIREFPENELFGNLESFRSYSTLTAKRRSKLYEFPELVSNAADYSETFKADHPNDNVSHMKYGPDISFEVCDKTDRTIELGQIGMNIDSLDDNGHLRGGFSVDVFDPQLNDSTQSISTKRSIIRVDNSSTLFVKQISLNGNVLTTNDNGDLLWNGKKVLTE